MQNITGLRAALVSKEINAHSVLMRVKVSTIREFL